MAGREEVSLSPRIVIAPGLPIRGQGVRVSLGAACPSPPKLKELGQRIQKARKEKNLTQQELADLSHVSLKHVQSCERGKKNPSFEVLRAFTRVLDLSLDSLMNLDMPEDEQTANEMRQLYLSCPPEARKVLLNSTRALADELKRMVQITDPDADIDLESK